LLGSSYFHRIQNSFIAFLTCGHLTTTTSGSAARGRQFFSNSIFSATIRAISKIFSGSCAPQRALLKFQVSWGSGSSNFFCFLYSNRHRLGARNTTCGNYRDIGPLSSLKFKKKSDCTFSRKWGLKILGAWHFLEFAPLGAPFPHVTLGDFGLRDPDKNTFCSGAIAPYLGEIWILAGLHFGPLFLENWLANFWNFKSIASTCSLLSILRFKKIWLA